MSEKIAREQYEHLGKSLVEIGLELIESRKGGMIEKIRQPVIGRARNEAEEKESKTILSVYLSKHLLHKYSYLSGFFSSIEGRSIENYFVEQRIEKVKELLVYKEMTLSEIAFEMENSSVAHLSNQFKKITGLTPSHFREAGSMKRKLITRFNPKFCKPFPK
ncbi:MAG: AraC family transcriptional regulator [Ferruginibacter sp.]